MSGVGGSEFILTRSLQRQLEEELDAEKNLGFDPEELKGLHPQQLLTPRDDDTYSPLHVEEEEGDDDEVAPDDKQEKSSDD